jgi:hypothetical protein
VLSQNATAIGEMAFYQCEALTDFAIPASVASIGKAAFYKCTSLNAITAANTTTEWILTHESIEKQDETATFSANAADNAILLKTTYADYTWTLKNAGPIA